MKDQKLLDLKAKIAGFSPASRIILIESVATLLFILIELIAFQSRKQDYFN